jgi:hypothetical protein
MNRYSYVGNDPVNRRDPTGLCDNWFILEIEKTYSTSADEGVKRYFSYVDHEVRCLDPDSPGPSNALYSQASSESTSPPQQGPPGQDPCPGDLNVLLGPAETAWQSVAMTNHPEAPKFARAGKALGAANLAFDYLKMRAGYERNDWTMAITGGAAFTIDASSNALPGWWGIAVGGACSIAGCGEAIGEFAGPPVQLYNDVFSDGFHFPGTLIRLHHYRLPTSCQSP